MAIVTEHPGSPTGGDVQEHLGRTYKRRLMVDTEGAAIGIIGMMLLPGVPQLFAPFSNIAGTEFDYGALCTKRDFKPRVGTNVWDIDVDYSTRHLDKEQQKQNPLDRPPEVSWEGERLEEVADLDRHGDPILNTAGQPYEPSLMRDYKLRTVVYTRNEATYDDAQARAYEDVINTDEFLGEAAYTWRVLDINARRAFEEGVKFWVVTYRMSFRKKGWRRKVMSQGFKDATGKEILDEHGNQPSEPWKLDAAGNAIKAAGAPGHTQTFEVYDEAPLAPLNITGVAA